MAKMLEALLHLQSIERQLATVRSRLSSRKNAVTAQKNRLEQLAANHAALNEKLMNRRKDGDRFSLDLKVKEEQVVKLRTSLNSAKTNKEYAAILTQINTYKADNAKTEEEALRVMGDCDTLKAEVEKAAALTEVEKGRLAEIEQASAAEVTKLEALMADLQAKRDEAAKVVPRTALSIFDRIAESNDGEGMAVIEIHGRKPPHEYICGGCYMSLNAEHANVLQTRDELRTCDNCGKILYLQPQVEGSRTQ
ncbi:MAG: C4-type zinc ribbon domain-containing protein [Phycisphaerae bacterium]|jgi:predicted  nucleic acid-binding Zn-ribbon protein